MAPVVGRMASQRLLCFHLWICDSVTLKSFYAFADTKEAADFKQCQELDDPAGHGLLT